MAAITPSTTSTSADVGLGRVDHRPPVRSVAVMGRIAAPPAVSTRCFPGQHRECYG
jgi:hypothetical protein